MFHKTKSDILNGNILQQMLLFFFPVFLGYLLQQAYFFADSIVLGRFVGKEGLAAVGGSATSVINIVLNLVSGMTAAITVMTAQNYGRSDAQKVNDSIRTGMFIAVVLGGIITVVMLISSPLILNLMSVPAETIGPSLVYMRLYFLSLVPYFIYQAGVSILRALGDSRRPVYFILLTAVVKILGDLILAGVFRLGVLGTSLATFLAHLVCAIVILVIFQFTPDIYQYSLKNFSCDREMLGQMIKIGIPFAIQSMMFAIPSTYVQIKINSFGTDAVAAFSAYNTVDNFFWCFSNSVAASTLTMAGQNYGNHNIARVKKTCYCAMAMEAVGATAIGLIFHFGGREIFSMFVSDTNVVDLCVQMLNVMVYSYILFVLVEPSSAVLKAIGSAKTTMYIAVVTVCFLRIAYLVFVPQVTAVYPIYCFPLSWIAAGIAYQTCFFLSSKLRKASS